MYIDIDKIWLWFSGAAGAVALIWAFYKNIKDIKAELKKPKDELNQRLDRIENKLSVVDSLKEDNEMIADCMYQVLDHMATNNNTGGMKKALDKYNKYYRDKE